MQIQFTGKNIDVTPAIKTYLTDKFQILSSHFNNLEKIHVVFHVDHLSQTAEATTHLYNTDFHATATNNDLYTAINELTHKLEKQLSSHKAKLINNHR